jgi:hypothetical protein
MIDSAVGQCYTRSTDRLVESNKSFSSLINRLKDATRAFWS